MVDVDALMSHAGFVRTLSRRLVMDEHYAEDAVQETFLRALERPPRATGALRTWLATVCRNFIHSSFRNDHRRILREQRAFKKDVAPTPGEIVEHETVRRSVVKALIALDKIYRNPIMLKYYEDMPPRKIAQRLNLPVETVRTRIRRGLSLMRNALDIDYGHDGRSWFLALLPVAGLYTKVSAPGAVSLATAGVSKLVVLMIGKPIVAAASLLCCATVFLGVSIFSDIDALDSANRSMDSLEPKAAEVRATKIINEPVGGASDARDDTAEFVVDSPAVLQDEKKTAIRKRVHRNRTPSSVKYMDPEEQKGMLLVTAGETWMGMDKELVEELSEGQKAFLDSLSRSIPKHKVAVDAFYCDIHEVTNEQWVQYLEYTNQNPSNHIMQWAWKNNTEPPKGEDRFPVRNVSLKEARAFARWCGKRIPTESEWMRAAAGDEERIYAWGNDWNRGKNCTNRRNTLSRVGSYKRGRSYFDIHDMTGSVWEWTNSRFERYPGYKPAGIKFGNKKVKAEPGFKPELYVIKGGHYLGGDLANRLAIREPLSLDSNQDSVGFRCIKDAQPGKTLFNYSMEDLFGSCISNCPFDLSLAYCQEMTSAKFKRSLLIRSYDHLMITPVSKSNKTVSEIRRVSHVTPEPIGVLSTNRALKKPNLPPGSYVLAYRNAGPYKTDRKAQLKREKAKIKAEEDRRRMEEEARNRQLAKRRIDRGIREKPKTVEEIMAEKRSKELEKQLIQEEEEFKRREAERQTQLESIGIVFNAETHIYFPRDKNLVVFMNAQDCIVGYVEVSELFEEAEEVPIYVTHESGSTQIEMGFEVPESKFAWLSFNLEIEDNPFIEY